MLLQLAMGIQRLEQYRKPNQLVLNTTTAIARHWLLPQLGEFHRLHPDIDLWLFTSDEEPDMAEQTVDLALRWDLAPQAECHHRVLLEDALLPLATLAVLAQPPAERTSLHGEREMDWHHWTLKGGEDLQLQTRGLNFSDPGLLIHQESESSPQCRAFCCWLEQQFARAATDLDGMALPPSEAGH
ncbi:LysR substrate-binding domain-containing protein [Aeromonas hydrophila]